VLLWFAGAAVVVVWSVFRDPALDYRLVVAGVLLPDAVSVLAGGPWLLHTLAGSAALLVGVMLATRGRRAWRRRLLALPIGTFLHLVLDGVWTRTELFWWPAFGLSFGDAGVPSLDRGLSNIPLELAGAVALVWSWRRFGLDDRTRRATFVRTGHLGRDVVT
jgi:hypothetical protein